MPFPLVRRAPVLGALLSLAAAVSTLSPLAAQEKVDVATIEKIKTEAMEHSQVMDLMSWMTDVYGPRLTWSPNLTKAGNWAATTMKGWGLANVHLEPWTTPAGLGWANERFAFQSVAPNPFIIQAVPRAWSAGTKGRVTGPAVIVEAGCVSELQQKYAGKLKNAFVMATRADTNPVTEFNAWASRLSDSALSRMAQPPVAGTPGGGRQGFAAPAAPPLSPACQAEATARAATAPPANANTPAGRGFGGGRFNVNSDTTALRWLEKQGVGAILIGGVGRGYIGGDIATDNGASRAKNAPQVPFVHVATESYGRLYRMASRGVVPTLELEMQNHFYPADSTSFNVIAEISGTDPALKDEVVMIGGHFDSWHSGTGATDNGAGSATMMEAMRILKTLGLQPRRTIRIGLWTGEEQGLMGSRAYVRDHFGFADSLGFHPTMEQAKFAAYFNVDNGSGKIRGVYQQGNADVAPIFTAWMTPFNPIGMQTLTIGNTGGTDHLSFDAVGLPGFQFIQDGLDYGSRTHHTNQDVYERIQPDDMKFNSAVLAAFAWQAAQRDERLPRKTPPGAVAPRGAGRGGQ
ncbi:MAG: M20/M25/M40 family metallo-hydrolase [Gemmatimonadota bacterium]